MATLLLGVEQVICWSQRVLPEDGKLHGKQLSRGKAKTADKLKIGQCNSRLYDYAVPSYSKDSTQWQQHVSLETGESLYSTRQLGLV